MKGIMFNYKVKILGAALIGFMFLLIFMTRIWQHLNILGLDLNRQYNLWICFLGLGLYMVAFSKEKREDERVRSIRSRSVLIGFVLLLTIVLILALIGAIRPVSLDFQPGLDLAVIACTTLSIYLILFYAGLRADSVWIYNEEKGGLINRKGKKSHLFILYASIIGILILTLLM